MSLEQLRALLAAACKAEGSRDAWAKRHGVSPSYVSDVLQSRREPGKKLLDALGVKKSVSYRRVKRLSAGGAAT